MRISDWSSDVCSSDLQRRSGPRPQQRRGARGDGAAVGDDPAGGLLLRVDRHRAPGEGGGRADQRRARARGHLRLSLPRRALRELERSEEHTSELQSLMRISYAVFCLKKKKTTSTTPKQQ